MKTISAAVCLLMLLCIHAWSAEKTHDFTSAATSSLSNAAAKWTLQLPADATKYVRVKGISVQTSGGSTSLCDFTVYRGATLASSGSVVTPSKVSATIEGGAVPAPQARLYSGANSTGGTQIGFPHRLIMSGDRVSVPFDALYLEKGETVMVSSGTCTVTVDVMFHHEEY